MKTFLPASYPPLIQEKEVLFPFRVQSTGSSSSLVVLCLKENFQFFTAKTSGVKGTVTRLFIAFETMFYIKVKYEDK